MTIVNQILTRLPQTLSSTSNIPTDVKFVFRDNKEENNSVKEVNAHKLILALVSDVFEREFYGTLAKKEVESVIDIEDAQQEVFIVMVDFIYNKQPDVSMHGLPFLGNLFYLAEKYNISALLNEIIKVISRKQICDESVLDIATVAEDYVFLEQFSETLYESVAVYLLKKFAGKLDKAIDFFWQVQPNQVNGLALLKVMSKMKEVVPPICDNCKAYPCMDGEGLTKSNFVPGARVVNRNGKGSSEVDRLVRIIEHMCQFVAVMKDGGTAAGFMLKPDYYMYNCEDK